MNAPNAPWVCTAAPNDSEATDAMPGLVAELHAQFAESTKLEHLSSVALSLSNGVKDEAIIANLRGLASAQVECIGKVIDGRINPPAPEP